VFAASPLREAAAYRLLPSALDFSAGERMRLYALALEQFLQHPLLGVGLNNFSVLAHRLRGVDTVPHNFALGFLVETGVIGLIAVLAWGTALATTLRAPLRAARTAGDPRQQALAIGPWAVFLIALVHNQFESTLYGEQFKVLLFLVAGAAWGLARPLPGAATAVVG
jgi:O-antigen ligase